jgi:transcriptional regulator with XRE-family HTH domain
VIEITRKITNVNTLKERLKFARELRGLSQGELAKLANCSQSTIGNVESGERDTLRNLVAVARALNCSADWLFDGHGSKPTPNSAPNGPMLTTEKLKEKLQDWRMRASPKSAQVIDQLAKRMKTPS